MVDQGKSILEIGIKNAPYDLSDRIIFIYGASNSAVAQTASISVSRLFSNTSNLNVVTANLVVNDIRSDPANSTVLTIRQGTIFFSNSFIYVATSNNFVQRAALTSF